MSRLHPKFGHGYVHTISPEQAVEDGITGKPFHMLAWAHDFCRRRKRYVLTTKEMHMSGVAIDNRTIQKYLRSLEAAGHIEKVSRGCWRILSFSRVGYKQADTANHAAKIAASTQPLKTSKKATSEALKHIIQNPSPPALLDQKDLSQILKANDPLLPTAALAHKPVAIVEATPAPKSVPAVEAISSSKSVVIVDVKTQVARQAGFGKNQVNNIGDTFLSMGVFASGKSLNDLLTMQSVDLDDLDTESILEQDRQEAALLRPSNTPKTAKATPPTAPSPSYSETPAPPPVSQTTQRLPKSVIRHTLGQMAEAIEDFTYGEKEINALRKWPVSEAQLMDLKNAAVARKQKGKVTVGVGAYLYGAVRRTSLGIVPRRRGG